MNDMSDIEWVCSCGQCNPDYGVACNGCKEERYPDVEQEMFTDRVREEMDQGYSVEVAELRVRARYPLRRAS